MLELFDQRKITLYVSDQTLDELRSVIDRPEVRAALPGITELRIESLFRRLDKKAVKTKPVDDAFRYPRDAADEPYINLAIAAHADFLITRDRDLLDLMTAYDETSKEFRQRFRFLRVLEPEDLLRTLPQS